MDILASDKRKILRKVFLYFDDVDLKVNHKFAGQLLAIKESNQENTLVKIDHWRGIENLRPFHKRIWLKRMYIPHRPAPRAYPAGKILAVKWVNITDP